jgi:hypothetical protein
MLALSTLLGVSGVAGQPTFAATAPPRKRLRRGTLRSVPALIAAIRSCIREHNKDPRPFIWTARPRPSCARSSVVKKR